MKHFPRIAIALILLICSWFMVTERWNGNEGQAWKDQFNTCDAHGYYAYLPDFFIKHDLSHQDEKEMYVNKTGFGRTVNKYFIGDAICWSPFFGMAAVYSAVRGQRSDGYTTAFKKSISIAGLFWLAIGLLCLAGILKLLNISDLVSGLTLILITLGTNLFHYAVMEPAMSHLYSFSTVCGFAYFGMRYVRSLRSSDIWLSILFFSLSVMIRPVNILWIILLLPWIAGGYTVLKEKFLSRSIVFKLTLVLGILIFLQCGAWYLETGRWFVRTYVGEGFRWFEPELIQTLAGFRKGWLVYTPFAALALFGFFPLWKKDPVAVKCFLLILGIHSYIIAAWWSWSFADSFGHRAFIDLYLIVAVLLAYFLHYIPKALTGFLKMIDSVSSDFIFFSLCAILLGFNIIQTYQYEQGILSPNAMDWKKYKYVFLKVAPEYFGVLGGSADLMPYSKKVPQLLFTSDLDFTKPLPEWETMPTEVFQGVRTLHFAGQEFGAVLKVPFLKEYCNCEKLFAKITLTRYEPQRNSANACLLVTNTQNAKKENEFYFAFPIDEEPADTEGSLQTFDYDEEIPCLKTPDSRLALYLWNTKHQDFYITHIKVRLFSIVPEGTK
ncbi:MAG: hypothetical protein ACHQRM_15060 [Bacteroidia bacterium]